MRPTALAFIAALAVPSLVFAQAAKPVAPPPAAPAKPSAAPAAPKAPQAKPGPGEHGGPHGDCPMMHGKPCDDDSCPMMQGKHGSHDGHDGDDGDQHLGMIEHMAEKLGVAEPVRKKIQDLAYEAKKRAIGLRADADRAKLELQRTLDQDLPDADAVLKQMDKVGQLKTEMKKVAMKAHLEVAKLLTPEQRAQLKHLAHGEFHHGAGPAAGGAHEHGH